MQHAEKAAAKAEAERRRRLGLEMQRRVVQSQLLQRLAEVLVVIGTNREQSREDTRLNMLKPRQRLSAGLACERYRIADGRAIYVLDAGDHETDLARFQLVAIFHLRREASDSIGAISIPGRHDLDLAAFRQTAVHHTNQ